MKNQLGKKGMVYRVFMYCLRIFPIQNNKIIISNYRGKGFGDNAKYIIEQLRRKRQDLLIIWLVENEDIALPDYIVPIKIDTLKALYHLSTSHIWIDNCRKPLYTVKRKKQFYIQTWHGLMGFKKIEKEAESLSDEYVQASINDSKMIDILLSGSKWCTYMLRRSFWYSGKILEVGSPRNDILLNPNENTILSVKKKIDIDDEFIVLYAPTFRANGNVDFLKFNFQNWIVNFQNRYKKKCKILLRLHPNIASQYENMEFGKNVINVSSYSDMQELLAVCNILITDYSSSAFEAALALKPVFLLCYDFENYIQNERSLQFDIEELPFVFCKSEMEFLQKINEAETEYYKYKIEKFLYEVGSIETGIASREVANLIENIISK